MYTSMFLCFRAGKLHQSTCSHVFSPFSAHFYPPLHHNGKGSIAVAQWVRVYLISIHGLIPD